MQNPFYEFLSTPLTSTSLADLLTSLPPAGIPIRFLQDMVQTLILLEPHETLFTPDICQLLTHLSKPLIALQASDFLNYTPQLPGLLSSLTWTFTTTSLSIRRSAAMALATIANSAAFLPALAASAVVEAFAEGLRLSGDPETLVVFLTTLRRLTTASSALCRRLANCGVLSRLLQYLRTHSDQPYIQVLCVDCLWNVLESDAEGAAFALGNADALEGLGEVLKELIARSYRARDRVLRNDLGCILVLVSRLTARTGTDTDGSVVDTFGTHSASLVGPNGPVPRLSGASTFGGIPHIALTYLSTTETSRVNKEDEEFRVLLLTLLTNLCETDETVSLLCADFKLIRKLLATIDVQKEGDKFQLAALNALFVLVRTSPTLFLAEQGVGITLRFARSTGRAKALDLLRLLSEQGVEIVQELVAQNAVGALLEILKGAQERRTPDDMKITETILFTLANIANSDQFRKSGGVDLLAFNIAMSSSEEAVVPSLQLALVNCVWKNVINSAKNESIFIDKFDGIFKLMDLFEVVPLDIKRMTLACLSDLLRNARAVAQFHAWHSKRNLRGSVRHVLDLWLFEQAAVNAVTTHGVIRDVRRPLNPIMTYETDHPNMNMTEQSFRLTTPSEGDFSRNAKFDASFYRAILPNGESLATLGRVTEDTRPLIYAIFKRLEFRVKEPLEIEHATQIPLIKRFPECRQLEIWQEIDQQLYTEQTRVTDDDANWRDTEIANLQTIVDEVYTEQCRLSDAQTVEDLGCVKATIDAFLSEKNGTLKSRNIN
jgi:hypothetical protein